MYPTPVSLYLHIPFCRKICTYCAFNTYAGLNNLVLPYVTALQREIEFVARVRPELAIHTVFFGGGTPSMISSEQLQSILNTVRSCFHLLDGAEITLEANPNDLNDSYLADILAAGINRLSIGMQSSQQSELKMYGRQHDHALTMQVVEYARRIGFRNISLDLIFGNPNQAAGMWEETLDAALDLSPDHISLYGLEIKGGTVLKQQIEAGELPLPDEETAATMYEMARTRLKAHGFRHYEISNWAKAGFEARHNLQYWHHKPYLGLGAGAHGYIESQRTIVIRSPQKYITAMENTASQRQFPKTPATSKITPVDREAELAETIMVRLRLVEDGIDLKEIAEEFGVDLLATKAEQIERLLALGMIEVSDERIRLSEKGHLLSTPVIAELY